MSVRNNISNLVAERYSKALFDLGKEKNELEVFLQDLMAISDLIRENKEFSNVIASKLVQKSQIKLALLDICKKLELSKEISNFCQVLVETRRISYLHKIFEAFKARLDKDKNIQKVNVITARDLSDELKANITTKIEQSLKSKTNIIFKNDAKIIGGMVIKIGSKLIDASTKRKLELLENMTKNAIAEELM